MPTAIVPSFLVQDSDAPSDLLAAAASGLAPEIRSSEGHFRWPRIADGVIHLSAAQLSAMLEGLDFTRVYPRDVARPTATQ
jgi:transposase